MVQPAVNITELDNALGITPTSDGRLVAFVGASSAGPFETPAAFARVKDLTSNFGSGPLVEAAAHFIDVTGRPVLMVRSNQTVAATVSAVTHTGTGASVASIAASPTPLDDWELQIRIIVGGTIASASPAIQYAVSYDGGRNEDPPALLGVATTITVGGVTFNFTTATVIAGDVYKVVTKAAQWNPAELTAALDKLGQTTIAWEQVYIVGTLDASSFDAVETKFAGWFTAGKYHNWVGNPRIPNAGESEAAYLTAMAAIFSSKATKYGDVNYAAAKIVSGVSGRNYRRPFGWAVMSALGQVTEEVDVADVNLGPLAGVAIRDANGNVDEHDESINPGADDARFTAARTWDGYGGVYINRPLLLSTPGSDFELIQHRRVINLAHATLRVYFTRRLNKAIRVNPTTGFILETEALEIEAGARSALRSVLLAKPKASAVQFTLSRTDNVLSTKTLTGSARITPLAYPEFINIDVGYYNPALSIQNAA